MGVVTRMTAGALQALLKKVEGWGVETGYDAPEALPRPQQPHRSKLALQSPFETQPYTS